MQTSGVTQYPVSISMAIYAPQHLTIRQSDGELQRLQNMLKAAEQQEKIDLEPAQTAREQQKSWFNQLYSSLQAQANAVAKDRNSLRTQVNSESQRLQNMLKVAVQQMEAAKAAWEQQKAQLNQQNIRLSQQNNSLQAQVNSLSISRKLSRL